jgi:tRNA(Arg) A34 adenosine deaminase TadA/catechol 2,3-dioxygenase-like lactoylglutathione lyase family enzyme
MEEGRRMTSLQEHARAAVRLATRNVEAGQSPFAAIVVADGGAGEVIATGVNATHRDADPTSHGEVEAIRAACRRLGTLDLSGAIVVSSCEPCPICQATAGMTGIGRIAYAATREQAAAGGFGFSDFMASRLGRIDDVMVELDHVEVDIADEPFEAWRAAGHSGAPHPRPIHELRVAVTAADHAAALTFYRDVLGLAQLADWTSPDGKVVVLDGGRATLELIDEAQASYIDRVEVGRRVAGPIRLALSVDDAAALAERARTNGAVLLGKGPVETPWGDRNVRLAAPADLQLTLFTAGD